MQDKPLNLMESSQNLVLDDCFFVAANDAPTYQELKERERRLENHCKESKDGKAIAIKLNEIGRFLQVLNELHYKN